jgi:hypothetical protein
MFSVRPLPEQTKTQRIGQFLHRNQVHRGDAEIAEGDCLMENPAISGILHKSQAFGQKVPRKGLKAFCLFRLNRNKQKNDFSAPSASAVIFPFWAGLTW